MSLAKCPDLELTRERMYFALNETHFRYIECFFLPFEVFINSPEVISLSLKSKKELTY